METNSLNLIFIKISKLTNRSLFFFDDGNPVLIPLIPSVQICDLMDLWRMWFKKKLEAVFKKF